MRIEFYDELEPSHTYLNQECFVLVGGNEVWENIGKNIKGGTSHPILIKAKSNIGWRVTAD